MAWNLELLTVSAIVRDDTSHAHSRSTFEKSTSDNSVGARDGVAATRDSQDTVVNALNNFADASFDASFVTEVCDVLATLSNNDTGFLGRNDGSKGKLGLGVFFVRLRGGFAIRAEAVFDSQIVQRIDDIVAVGRKNVLGSRHGDCVLDENTLKKARTKEG